jgi:nucleolar pre-ribosomal-associated protein 2
MVSQFGVESVLAGLVILGASTRHTFLEPAAPVLYLKLCRIVNSILLLHRKTLGGRMHILVPVLETLLNCLFTIHPNSKPPKSQKCPTWIQQSKSKMSEPQAVAYSRILLTWTQPTMASVTSGGRSAKNSLLTDETRKARDYVAQYAPYVLMHFCSLHLVGNMAPEVRKAVLPGIWACIEVIPRERLRGMNASMGRDERAIWSSLWAEWRRVHGHTGDNV